MIARSLETAKSIPASAIIGSRVGLRRAGRNHVGCCPFHEDKTPSLYVFSDSNRFHCFGCEAHGDAIDFVQMFDGCSFEEALNQVTGERHDTRLFQKVTKGPEARSDTEHIARDIWAGGKPIENTVAETYLANRGIVICDLPCTRSLRFDYLTHPKTKQRHPTLISRLDDAEGTLRAIQRTFLTDDGWKLPKVKNKLSLGSIGGHATRLSPINGEIVLCEGLEDGLSLQTALPNVSVWVTAGTSNLAKIVVPTDQVVTIAADNDPPGTLAAMKAAQALATQGVTARIIHPDHQFKDFNEQHQKGLYS